MSLPYPLIRKGWKYGSGGTSPLHGVSYSTDLKSVLYELWRVGLASKFKVSGSSVKGLYSLRSKELGSEVHDLRHSTITDVDDPMSKTEEVAWLLKKCFNKPSVQDAASMLIKKARWLDQTTNKHFRFKSGYLGGIQWSDREIQSRGGSEFEGAYYSDIREAYVETMLRRKLPTAWKWVASPEHPNDTLASQDSMYMVECRVPEWLPWGFPIGRETVNGEYSGLVTGEEILSANIPRTFLRVIGRFEPTGWSPHPAYKILDLPRAVRRRVGITIYGLHAKGESKFQISMVGDRDWKDRDAKFEAYKEAYIRWDKVEQPRPFARIDYAALTTSRVRSALVRAALDMDSPVMMYVDGIIGDSPVGKDTMWPGIIDWKLKAEGRCVVWSPGVYRFDEGPTTKRGESAMKEWLANLR